MDKAVRLTLPLSIPDVEMLYIGDRVLLNGIMYTGRDAAHDRLVQSLAQGEPLPFDLEGQVIYYVGPSPALPGQVMGAAGPTSSYRMDGYAPTLIARGLRGMIGKGARNQAVKDAMRRYKAVYFAAIGGAGALIARSIIAAESHRLSRSGHRSGATTGSQGFSRDRGQRYPRRRPLRRGPEDLRPPGRLTGAGGPYPKSRKPLKDPVGRNVSWKKPATWSSGVMR